MPVIKVKGGYKIRRSKGGLYPKVYKSKATAQKRVKQMEAFKSMRGKKRKK